MPSLVCTITSLLPDHLKDILNSAEFFPETTLYALIIQENSVSPYLESSMSQSFSLIRTSRLRAIVFLHKAPGMYKVKRKKSYKNVHFTYTPIAMISLRTHVSGWMSTHLSPYRGKYSDMLSYISTIYRSESEDDLDSANLKAHVDMSLGVFTA